MGVVGCRGGISRIWNTGIVVGSGHTNSGIFPNYCVYSNPDRTGDGSPSPSAIRVEEIFCIYFDIIIKRGKRRYRRKRRYEQMVRVLRVVATGSAPPAGAQVRVIKPVQVYHVGKFKDGLNLEGRVGTVVQDVSSFEGKVLSATLPYKVEFSVDGEGDKPVKVLAHVEADEIEVADPLEQFCEEDPSADECRVYE